MIKQSRTIKRNQRGQALIEGTVALVMLVGIFVVFVIGAVDAYAFVCYSEKAKMAAQAAANAYSGQRTLYNSMILPDSEESTANTNAVHIANYIMDQLGLPSSRNITVRQDVISGALVSRADVTINCLLPFQGISGLPGSITVSAFNAVGFGKARLAKITIPDGLVNTAENLDMTNYRDNKRHMCINLPIYWYSEAEMPGAETIDPRLNIGQFPNGYNNTYYPGFHVLGVGRPPGHS